MRIIIKIVLVYIVSISNLVAQEKVQIPTTNLTIDLTNGYEIDENDATMFNSEYGISFIEMTGVDYDSQKEDFANIEESYAEKGILVKNHVTGKLGKYGAQFITLDTRPSIYQVFFGDNSFCALANVIAVDSFAIINETDIKNVLNTLEYTQDNESALDKHANFKLNKNQKDWKFVHYTAGIFGFENNHNKNSVLITQLPAAILGFGSKEDLANTLVSKFQEKTPDVKIFQSDPVTINDIEGHRILLSSDGKLAMDLIYIFVFGSDKSTFAFQGIGEVNDEASIKELENFLNNFELK